MAKLLLLSTILTLTLLLPFGVKFSTNVKVNNPIMVEGVFGRGPECTGRGLCSMEQGDAQIAGEGISCKFIVNSASHLTIKVQKSSLNYDRFKSQIKDDQFILDEDFYLSSNLMTAAGHPCHQCFIPKGVYPVHNNSVEATIGMTIKNN